MKILATLEGHDIQLDDDGVIQYSAKMAIDDDGTGSSHGDPYFQPRTSLRINGVSLNSDVDRYIVVPPAIIRGVTPIVLGCQAFVTYLGRKTAAVVGDVGPYHKIGEASIACANALGIPSSPNTGGVDSGVFYEIHPGVPAVVNGKTYQLQAS